MKIINVIFLFCVFINTSIGAYSSDTLTYEKYTYFIKGKKGKVYDSVLTTKYQYYFDIDGNKIMHGKFEEYDYSIIYGKLTAIEQGTYLHNKKNGIWKFYDDNGNLKSENNFYNDFLFGRQVEYFNNKISVIKNIDSNEVLNGELEIFYPNGVKAASLYCKNDNLNGEYSLFYDNGNLMFRAKYLNNKLQDTSYSYFEDGKLMGIKFEGKTIVFNRNGTKYMEKSAISTNFRYMYFYENGMKRNEELSQGDSIVIYSHYYDSIGNLLDTGSYFFGNGILNKFEGNNLFITKKYIDTELQEMCYYYKNGKRSHKVMFFSDGTDVCQFFDTNGKTIQFEKLDNKKLPSSNYMHEYKYDANALINVNKNFLNYIKTSVKYPLKSREDNVEGKVVIGFKLSISSKIEDIKIISNTADADCAKEAMRVLKSTNLIPSTQYGFPVNTYYTLPVTFKLQ